MGALRELKKSLEAYWKARELEVDLHRTASDLRRIHWLQQKEAGIDLIQSNDLSRTRCHAAGPERGAVRAAPRTCGG
jgi:hypothetical protein